MPIAINMEFPALCLAENGFISSVGTEAQLATCTPTALRNGYFSNLNVVDARGQLFIVIAARKGARVGRCSVIDWLMGTGRVSVDLEFQMAGTLELSEIQARVSRNMDLLPHQWTSVEPLERTKARVRRAASAREIADLFRMEDGGLRVDHRRPG